MLQIDFPAGTYSKNKEQIKEVIKILGFKYTSGKPIGEQLICLWKKDKYQVKGIFNGSGKECSFIINSGDEDIRVFEEVAKAYYASYKSITEQQNDSPTLRIKAKELVDKWFTSQVKNKLPGEPDIFYQHRIKKEEITYNWFIESQYKKLIGE